MEVTLSVVIIKCRVKFAFFKRENYYSQLVIILLHHQIMNIHVFMYMRYLEILFAFI
jgi:hypothetical protein